MAPAQKKKRKKRKKEKKGHIQRGIIQKAGVSRKSTNVGAA